MSGNLKDITSADFKDTIATGITLVDFWATWCGPCRMLTPVLEKISGQMGDKVSIVKVNVDEAQDLAADFGVQSIPTMILFKDGEQIDKKVGMQTEQNIISWIESV